MQVLPLQPIRCRHIGGTLGCLSVKPSRGGDKPIGSRNPMKSQLSGGTDNCGVLENIMEVWESGLIRQS